MMYYLGSFIVRVMMGEFPAIPAVPEEVMIKARELNLSMLRFLGTEERPENFSNLIDDIIAAHPQPDLLRHVFDLLARDPHCRKGVRDENVWILFAQCKIVIDALGKANPCLN